MSANETAARLEELRGKTWLSREEAAEYLNLIRPANRRPPPAVETISRFFHQGKHGVYLRYCDLGANTVCTKAAWIDEFLAARTAAKEQRRRGETQPLPVPSRTLRRRYAKAAAANAAAGIR